MSHEWIIWVLLAASALHVMEEQAFGWQGWASETLGTHPTWADFWATNAAMIVIGLAAAAVGWAAPAFALGFPALVLINAVVFHVVPSVQARRPNPGLFTAVALYLPLGAWCYVAAAQDDVLSAATVIGSVLVGAALMAVAYLALALKPRFRYPDVP